MSAPAGQGANAPRDAAFVSDSVRNRGWRLLDRELDMGIQERARHAAQRGMAAAVAGLREEAQRIRDAAQERGGLRADAPPQHRHRDLVWAQQWRARWNGSAGTRTPEALRQRREQESRRGIST